MSDLRVTVYTPESPLREPGKLFKGLFRDLAASRELAWRLFVRDTSSTYRQSVLGYLWAFAPPLVTTATFVFLSSQQIINLGPTDVPYPAFVMIGTLLWQALTEAMNAPLKATNNARSMLMRINFPREALLLAGLAEVILNCLIRTLLFVPVFVYYHLHATPTLPLAALGLAGLILIGFSIGLLLTPIGLLYGDVGRMIPLASTFWMLLSPVVYPVPRTGVLARVAEWNPVTPLLETTRSWITGDAVTHIPESLVVLAGFSVVLVIGWLLYRLGMPILIERMGG